MVVVLALVWSWCVSDGGGVRVGVGGGVVMMVMVVLLGANLRTLAVIG